MTHDASPEWLTLRVHFQAEAQITLPRSGDAAHKLAAKAAAQAESDPRCTVPPEFFHHHIDAAGRRVVTSGLSPFRFGAGRDSLTLTAVGNEAVDLLEGGGHRLVRSLSRFASTPLRETWTRGALSLRSGAALHHYRIGFAILSRKPLRALPVGADLEAGSITPAVQAWAAQRILDGIARQARLIGLPEPDADALLQVTRIGGTSGYQRGIQRAYYGSVAKDVTFSSDIALRGPWAVGHLCLIDEGRIDVCRTPREGS